MGAYYINPMSNIKLLVLDIFINKFIYSIVITLLVAFFALMACNVNSDSFEKQETTSFFTNGTIENNRIELCNNNYLALDTVREMIGCNNDYTGKNITVAIIDSGVYPHDNLMKPRNRIIAFKDFVNNYTEPYDDNGHGTAMAGIIAGNGFISDGRHKGIAPECNIVAIKVLDSNGFASVKNIASAIDWVCENKDAYNISIINISIGVDYNDKDYIKLEPAIDKATDIGLLIIASVGNSIGEPKRIYLPAAFANVLAVGSIEDLHVKKCNEYKIAYFSSYWEDANNTAKPDIVAPGNFILSLQSIISYSPARDDCLVYDTSYALSFGTSNSAAIVSGVAALLWEEYPDENAVYIKDLILDLCVQLNEKKISQGDGFLYLGSHCEG